MNPTGYLIYFFNNDMTSIKDITIFDYKIS